MSSATTSTPWLNRRPAAAGLFVLAAVSAYLLALRALNTGSLQQYFLTLVLIIFAINRLVKTFRKVGKQ